MVTLRLQKVGKKIRKNVDLRNDFNNYKKLEYKKYTNILQDYLIMFL